MEQTIFVTAAWLVATNLSSVVSLFFVNDEASQERGRLIRDKAIPSECRQMARRVERKLRFVYSITWVMVLFLVLVIFLLIYHGPSASVIHFATISSGGIYLFVVFLNDLIGHSAIKNCENIKEKTIEELGNLPDGPTKENKKEFLEELNEQIVSMSFFTKVVFLVDIPILLGLAIIYCQEYGVLNESVFRLGFATGAIAMHILAANLVSIALSVFVFQEAQSQ
ncbi:MAG TPA: hypothetical protein VJ464_05925 [Blastocatellia bacterium]|nr:hypothetical protein [Blastocatellia bacterium]